MPFWKASGLILCLGALLACGGGSSGGGTTGPAMSLASHQALAQGTVNNPAPTVAVPITLTGTSSSPTSFYVGYQTTTNGVATVALGGGSGNVIEVVLTFKDPTTLGPGTYTDTLQLAVATDAAGASQIAGSPQSVTVTYTVVPAVAPTLTSLSPATVAAGGQGFTLAVTGTQFNNESLVYWNGTFRPTTFLSATQLTARISANDIAGAGTASVTINNLANGGGVSTPLTFTIGPPGFGITLLAPATVSKGGPAFTLTVHGDQFQPSSTVLWNGSPRATTYYGPTQLTAAILASDLAAAGSAAITVLNPGGPSGAWPLTINAGEAVAMQIDPGHSGTIQFPSVTLPTASLWSRTLDGPPSYALIAQGMVYVTVPVGRNLELVALDQATGATAWGPVTLTGPGNAAYDNGQVFVLCGNGGNTSSLVQAFDAGTGVPRWSSVLPGGYGPGGPPVAANGVVYAGGWGGALTAFQETTGAVAWTNMDLQVGGPAVSAAGLYLGYPNAVLALDPGTGALLWQDAMGGASFGEGTTVLADGLLYAPDQVGTRGGQVLDARTGALVGTYAADNTPAIAAQNGYFLQGGTLRCIQLGTGTVLWSFAGDGGLGTSPIVVNSVVFIGSASGNLYGLDAATGAQVWLMALGAAPATGDTGVTVPQSGLAAGDGLLVVPAGTTVTAYQLAAGR